MSDWYSYPPSKPKTTSKGIKAKSRRGAFAKHWWAQRWIETLESLLDAGRLQRGKRYARQGQVLSLQEQAGAVQAQVQGSRRTPYRVRIALEPLSDERWDRVLEALAQEAVYAAQLLAGEMPEDIEAVFTAAGVALFPSDPAELETSCTCPDYAEVCKHVAATHYILAESFDEDPFLLFRLRGRSAEMLMAGLKDRRPVARDDAGAEAATFTPLRAEGFWDVPPLAPLKFTVAPPGTPLSVLKRLGPPAFLESLEALLRPSYESVSQAAIQAALAERETDEDDDPS